VLHDSATTRSPQIEELARPCCPTGVGGLLIEGEPLATVLATAVSIRTGTSLIHGDPLT